MTHSLEGLSVGDAFGERFFFLEESLRKHVRERILPDAPWRYTDDTEMVLSLGSVLKDRGQIDSDLLAHRFAENYHPRRGYGAAMHGLLQRIRQGESWEFLAPRQFGGQGSCGNGSAMRVAPLGAYFADDLDLVVEQARLSSRVTHTHPEGIAGAIAVAVAAAIAARYRGSQPPTLQEFLDLIFPHVPESMVRRRMRLAMEQVPLDAFWTAIQLLGNGGDTLAQDTVPMTLWCAGQFLDRYEDALWFTAGVMGDIDTNCAIVGGIVASYTGKEGIPEEWLRRREALPSDPQKEAA
jgi:ADP-ribosylglycohydrolase